MFFWHVSGTGCRPRLAALGTGAISTRRLRARPLLVGIRGHRLLGAEGCGEHRGGGQALADQCARHGERALGGSSQLSSGWLLSRTGRSSVKPLTISARHSPEVGRQRRRQLFEQLPACGLQLVGIECEQHAAADADASVVGRVTRPPRAAPRSAFSSASRRCSATSRLCISASRLLASSICTPPPRPG